MKNDKTKAKDTIKTQSIGRPKKELDKDVIAKLSQIGCTQEEIGSVVGISARGESIARKDNYCEIDPNVVDEWGIPVLRFNYKWSDLERNQAKQK